MGVGKGLFDVFEPCSFFGQQGMPDGQIGLGDDEQIIGKKKIIVFHHGTGNGILHGDKAKGHLPFVHQVEYIVEGIAADRIDRFAEMFVEGHLAVCPLSTLKCDFHQPSLSWMLAMASINAWRFCLA
jgi:hypothetical protein